jgi:NAD(P)-dependent dehydrogenase (short-subunit alcohol dehydrogenase family)
MDVRDLHGKSALVTGAASGIGRESALAFGRRGADLVVCDLDETGLKETEAQLRSLGRDVLARRVDVADPEDVRAFAEETNAQLGVLDILMNNAGVGLGASFLDTSLEDWDRILRVNVRGVVHGCHYFVPPMVRRGAGGHVVNVSSAAGFLPAEALSAYVTTKYAVLGLTESLRIELRRHGIGVTAICPGIVDTPITRSSPLRGQYAEEGQREEMVEAYRKRGYGPERVAENVLKAIQRNRGIAPVTPEAWIAWYAKRLSPALVSRLMGWAEQRRLAR